MRRSEDRNISLIECANHFFFRYWTLARSPRPEQSGAKDTEIAHVRCFAMLCVCTHASSKNVYVSCAKTTILFFGILIAIVCKQHQNDQRINVCTSDERQQSFGHSHCSYSSCFCKSFHVCCGLSIYTQHTQLGIRNWSERQHRGGIKPSVSLSHKMYKIKREMQTLYPASTSHNFIL